MRLRKPRSAGGHGLAACAGCVIANRKAKAKDRTAEAAIAKSTPAMARDGSARPKELAALRALR